MANYNTTSGFSDLTGSMVVTNNNVDSYTSNTQGAGTVQNLGGSNLKFNVRFPSVTQTYHINATANANGNGYGGNANNNSPEGVEETWSATGSTGDTADASKAENAYGSAGDTAKKAAS